MSQPQWNTPQGTVGTYASGASVNFTFNASSTSGVFNLRYFLQSGTIPAGLSLNTLTGVLSGTTPVLQVDTTYNFTLRASDGAGNLRDRTFNITVQKDAPPNFTTPAGPLFASIVDTNWVYYQIPYTTSLSDPTITMSVVSGSLPAGLWLNTNGILQGYPSAVALPITYSFTLKISNSIGSNTRTYTISVTQNTARVPVILNNRPLTQTVSPTNEFYGYYRFGSEDRFTGSIATTPGVASIVGDIMGNTLTVTSFVSGTTLQSGDTVIGVGIPANTYIVSQTSGISGMAGTYTLSATPTPGSAIAIAVDRTILTVTAVETGVIEIGRSVQDISGTGVIQNTLITSQLTPLLTGESLGGIGRYGVSIPQAVASTQLELDIDIGTYYYGDQFAWKVLGYDFDSLGLTYSVVGTLPGGLTLNAATGWITGTPTPATGTNRFSFTIQATNTAAAVSTPTTFSVAFSNVNASAVTWTTPSNLGTINNYQPSTLSLLAVSNSGIGTLKYRVVNGSLPPALRLLDDGLIVGKVGYNATTYQLQPNTTTTYTFTVEAYLDVTPSVLSSTRTFTLGVFNKYNVPVETVYLKCTPPVQDRRLLEAGTSSQWVTVATVTQTVATSRACVCATTESLVVGMPIQFTGTTFGGIAANTTYWVVSIPTTTTFNISDSVDGPSIPLTTAAGTMTAQTSSNNPIALFDSNAVTVLSPSGTTTVVGPVIPPQLVYRPSDPYFGLNKNIRIDHIYGVNANDVDSWTTAVNKRHYRRSFVLGPLKTAVARDSNNNIIYEVVYSELIDNLVNPQGMSVSYEIKWPQSILYPQNISWYIGPNYVYRNTSFLAPNYYTDLVYSTITYVYPNSLKNMEKSIVDELGRITDTSLMPLWMTSQQTTGGTIGYTPAWVICYTVPGGSATVKNNIEQLWGNNLNMINFDVDRILVDKNLTFDWNKSTQTWTNLPSATMGTKTITGTFQPNQVSTSDLLDDWYTDMAFTLSSSTGAAIGGLEVNTVYYVRTVDNSVSPARFTVSKSLSGATENLVTAGLAPGQIITATPVYVGVDPTDSKDYMIHYDHPTILL